MMDLISYLTWSLWSLLFWFCFDCLFVCFIFIECGMNWMLFLFPYPLPCLFSSTPRSPLCEVAEPECKSVHADQSAWVSCRMSRSCVGRLLSAAVPFDGLSHRFVAVVFNGYVKCCVCAQLQAARIRCPPIPHRLPCSLPPLPSSQLQAPPPSPIT